MAERKKAQPKKAAKQAKPTTVTPLLIADEGAGRDPQGRFTKGYPHSFKPGECGNPNGRPKRTKLSDALIEKLAAMMPDAPEETIAEGVARVLIEKALSGDVQAIREIGDRTEGKPPRKIELDARLTDWRELARANGISEQQVLDEARREIESAAFTNNAEAD